MRKSSFEEMARQGRLSAPPLTIRVAQAQRGQTENVIVTVAWRGRSSEYVAELKRDAKPQTLKLAIDEVKRYARKRGRRRPMIIAPYFSAEKLDELLGQGVSALDFCGNAAIEAPGKFLFYKTGNPNQYRASSPVRSAYRGDSSLVARVLLLKRRFETVGAVLAAIRERGGSLTLGTVSKALQRLESDLVIERPSRSLVRLIQPERLLDGLLEAYEPPRSESTWTGRVVPPPADLLARFEGSANKEVVRTGESSAGEYAAWAGEPIVA